jgi:CRISPR-associated protein Csm1
MADRAERRAKIERDSIDIFGVSMRFKEFNDIEDDFNKVVEFLEKERDDKTTFYYKLIELCDMRERLDNKEQFNPQDALWKSKLNYLFRRNVKQKDNDSKIFTKLNNLIEKGEKFKPSIFLQIYKNRDKKKEKRDD